MTTLIVILALVLLFLLYFRGCFIEQHYMEQIIYIEAYLATYNYGVHSPEENKHSFEYLLGCFDEVMGRNLDKGRTKYAWAKFTNKFNNEWMGLLLDKESVNFELFKKIQNKI